MTTATYRSVVNKQKSDWRKYGRAGETYDKFCSRYYKIRMNISDKLKVVHLALSMLGVPIFIHLSYIKLYDDYVNSYLILLVVLVLILDINDIVKELLG